MSLFLCCTGMVSKKPEGRSYSTVNNFSCDVKAAYLADVFIAIKPGTEKEDVLALLKEMAEAIERYDPETDSGFDFGARFLDDLKKRNAATASTPEP